MLRASSGERLRNGTVSVCLSACPVDRQQQRHAAGLQQLVHGRQTSMLAAGAAAGRPIESAAGARAQQRTALML